MENKENPVVGYATKALRGTDPVGNKINLASEAGKLVIPLNFQSTHETIKNQGSIPKGIAMNIPGTFGVGVQTYGTEKTKDKDKVTQAKSKTPAETLAEANKKRAKSFKESLSEEDYTLSQLSKADRQKLVDEGYYTQDKMDGLDKYVANKRRELGYRTTTSTKKAKVTKKTSRGKKSGSTGRSSGSNSGSLDPYKYAVSLNAGGSIAKPKVTVKKAGAAPTKKSAKRAAPKVSLKKSLV